MMIIKTEAREMMMTFGPLVEAYMKMFMLGVHRHSPRLLAHN